MIFKKLQEGYKIRRTYRIFGYTRRDKLFVAFEADRFNHSRTSSRRAIRSRLNACDPQLTTVSKERLEQFRATGS